MAKRLLFIILSLTLACSLLLGCQSGREEPAPTAGEGVLNLYNIDPLTLDPAVFEGDDGLSRLAGLIRTLVDEKIQEVQINVISADTLRAAQEEPEKYQGLVVKVAGYSAFFVKLFEGLQNTIIARTEHRF